MEEELLEYAKNYLKLENFSVVSNDDDRDNWAMVMASEVKDGVSTVKLARVWGNAFGKEPNISLDYSSSFPVADIHTQMAELAAAVAKQVV